MKQTALKKIIPQVGAAEGIAGKDRGGRHAAGITWLSGSQLKWAAVTRKGIMVTVVNWLLDLAIIYSDTLT